jgi:hypothetical protein
MDCFKAVFNKIQNPKKQNKRFCYAINIDIGKRECDRIQKKKSHQSFCEDCEHASLSIDNC